jgi:hypothetical protein
MMQNSEERLVNELNHLSPDELEVRAKRMTDGELATVIHFLHYRVSCASAKSLLHGTG